MGVTLASRGSRPAGGKAPGQHGGFVVAVKQERGEGPRAGEKGSHEEEVRAPALRWGRPWVWPPALKPRPGLDLNSLWLRPQSRFPSRSGGPAPCQMPRPQGGHCHSVPRLRPPPNASSAVLPSLREARSRPPGALPPAQKPRPRPQRPLPQHKPAQSLG